MKKPGRIGLALLICMMLAAGLMSGTAYAAGVRDDAEEAEISVSSEPSAEGEELFFGDDSDWQDRSGGLTKTRALEISEETRNAVSDMILTGIKNWSESIDVSSYGLTIAEGRSLYYEVLDAHYEFFYVKNGFSYAYTGTDSLYSVRPLYETGYTQDDVPVFNSLCESIVAEIPQGTNAEKLLWLHDYLVTHCEYDLSLTKRDAYAALAKGSAVCDGYAKAFKHLCDLAGLTCEYVSSEANTHAWNLVQVKDDGDTAYYYIDCTWDDPTSGSGLTAESLCSHANFLMSREECAVKHLSNDWINGKKESVYDYPTSTKYQDCWWEDLSRSVQWVSTQMCYAKSDDCDHVFFRSSGTDSETAVTIQGGGNYWFVWGDSGSYWSGSYITVAAQNGAFYYSTPTQIWKLTTGGEMSLAYTLNADEQSEGYIYGIQSGAKGLTYYIGQDPNHASVATGFLDLSVPDIVASGTCGAQGDNLTWTFDSNGALTIGGTGEMASYSGNEPWYSYKSEISQVVISEGVTSISDYVFADCISLTSVMIGSGVSSIGRWAFFGCSSLTDVYYNGTKEEWNIIDMAEGNDPLKNALLCYHEHSSNTFTWNWAADNSSAFISGTCSKCGKDFTMAAVITSVATEATCTETGQVVYTATVSFSGETYTDRKIVEIPAAGHAPGEPVREKEKAATCAAAGSYDEVTYCTVCHEELSRTTKTIDKLAHTPGGVERENEKAATCAAAGSYDEVTYCTVCHEELSRETKTIGKLAHTPGDPVRENDNPATTEAEGSYDEVVYCEHCHEELSREHKMVEKLIEPVVITTQPANKSVTTGAMATFTVATSGTGLTYQWQKSADNGSTWTNISGATSASYTLTAKESDNGTLYRCVVKNSGGKAVSGTAKLTVTAAKPAITTQPTAQSVTAGKTATFTVAASGTGLSYQWQSSTDSGSTWTNISGAASASYTLTAKESDNGTLYRCVVKNSGGKAVSGTAKLTVTAAKPTITTQPAAQSVTEGKTATFTVAASGTGLSYQWQKSVDSGSTWTNISGAAAASYTFTTKEADNGTFFRCVVKNAGGKAVSGSAELTVTAAKPAITTQPANKTVTAGKTATFTVAASGTGLSYQWQKSVDSGSTWTNISGAAAASYTFTTKEADNGTFFRCVVKNAGGKAVSGSAELTVTAAALVISSIKANVTSAKTGETITWTAKAAGGSGTLQYYFILYKDGTKLKTQAYSTKNTFSYTPTEAGTYKVKVYVKDAAGTKVYKTSTGVTVTAAAAAPTVTSVKASVTSAYAGEKITWTAAASGGSGTLKYYFILYKDGTKIKTRSYSTTKTFSYTPTEAGNYKVKVYVKDSAGAKSYKTGGKVAVTLGPLAIVSVKAGKTSSAVGEQITWTAAAVGSEQPLKYYFILYKDGVKIKTRSYSTVNTFSYTPTEAGTYKVKVYVKDAEGTKVYKSSAKITVS